MPVIDDFELNLPIPTLDSQEPLASLFKKFLVDDIGQFICNESVRYTQSKGNHSYKFELHDLKAFIAIHQFSRYVDLLRRLMFWECSADVHNGAVSSIMSRNRFDEIMNIFIYPTTFFWIKMTNSAKYDLYLIN